MTSGTKRLLSDLAISKPAQVKAFGKMKVIIEDIAIVTLKDKTKLDLTKLKDDSYWKSLFHSYNKKLRRGSLDERIAAFAIFYRHTEEALNFALSSQSKIQTIHREVTELQEKLVKASPATVSAQREFLQQYVDMLNAGVEALEASRAECEDLQKEKMQNLKDLLEPSKEAQKKFDEGMRKRLENLQW